VEANFHQVFIVPIRDWNLVMGKASSKIKVEVFIVPIRDWNRSQLWLWNIYSRVFIVPIRDWNLTSSIMSSLGNLSFYRPYKGLKLYCPFSTLYISSVFIVPIRDWNFSSLGAIVNPVSCVFIVPIRDWNQMLFHYCQSVSCQFLSSL